MKRRGGFTLIEMIGVLAVIAILAALVAPKIFKVINDSRVTRLAGDIRGLSSGVADWYKDIRTLNPLVAADGLTSAADNAAWQSQLEPNGNAGVVLGLWAQWQGPYIDPIAGLNALGNAPNIENCASAGIAAAAAAGNCTTITFDDASALTDVAVGRRIVWLTVTGVSQADFESLDTIIDNGMANATRQVNGKVKWVAAGGGTMRVYLASN